MSLPSSLKFDLPSSLALYIHIPFCLRKCVYCDFPSFSGLLHLREPYVQALCKEISLWGDKGVEITTVYFGGGTPSLLSPEQVEKVLGACRAFFILRPEAETSLEANPGTVSPAYLARFRDLGINRLSLGVQSFDNADLERLGRLHSEREALSAYPWAREAGFDNINLDLIYGLPLQTLEGWRGNLEKAVSLGPEHLSLYALTLEEDVPMARAIASGALPAPDPDLAAEMYLVAEEVLGEAGYEHYEISNWARPGKACHHNLTYWENLPYLGVGAGAHSHLGGYRFSHIEYPARYIEMLNSPSLGEGASPSCLVQNLEAIPLPLEIAETAILGLRLVAGLDLRGFARRFGPIEALYSPEIAELVSLGLLEKRESRLCLTQKGRLLGNEVFLRFLPKGGNEHPSQCL